MFAVKDAPCGRDTSLTFLIRECTARGVMGRRLEGYPTGLRPHRIRAALRTWPLSGHNGSAVPGARPDEILRARRHRGRQEARQLGCKWARRRRSGQVPGEATNAPSHCGFDTGAGREAQSKGHGTVTASDTRWSWQNAATHKGAEGQWKKSHEVELVLDSEHLSDRKLGASALPPFSLPQP